MRRYFLHFILVTFLIPGFSSCHNIFDDDDDEPANEYLIDYEMVKSYLPSFVETGFDLMVQEYPEMAVIRERVQYGIMVYKINYKTTFKGEQINASGLVSVPISGGTFPLLSYQNGTNTLHSNAPSVNPNYELYMLLEFVASTGFVISMPDYLGFGTSDDMFHPYLHAESTVQSVTDMLRAVKEFSKYVNLTLNNDLYITGYSQGGWSTMQLQKAIEEKYSNEFNLRASVPAAGPYDLTYINDYITGSTTYPMPYFLGYIFNSYYELEVTTVSFSDIFKEPYASKIPDLYDGSKSGEEINAELTTSIDELLTQNYINNYKTDEKFSSLTDALEENSIGAWKTTIPTRIVHGTDDEFVPFRVSQNIYDDFKAKGAGNVTLVSVPGAGHTDGIIPAGLISIGWFLELTE